MFKMAASLMCIVCLLTARLDQLPSQPKILLSVEVMIELLRLVLFIVLAIRSQGTFSTCIQWKILIWICHSVSSDEWHSIIHVSGRERGNVGNFNFRSIWFSFRNFRNFRLNALHFGNSGIFGFSGNFSRKVSVPVASVRNLETDRQLHVWRTATVNAWCSLLTELKKCSFWANWMNTQVHT